MRTHTATFGNLAGSVYVALGIIGFAASGFDGFAAPEGVRVFGLELNPLHNLIHVVLGLALLASANWSDGAARAAAVTVASATGVAGLLGLLLTGWETPLALNPADNAVHLLTATAALGSLAADRTTVTPPTVRKVSTHDGS